MVRVRRKTLLKTLSPPPPPPLSNTPQPRTQYIPRATQDIIQFTPQTQRQHMRSCDKSDSSDASMLPGSCREQPDGRAVIPRRIEKGQTSPFTPAKVIHVYISPHGDYPQIKSPKGDHVQYSFHSPFLVRQKKIYSNSKGFLPSIVGAVV